MEFGAATASYQIEGAAGEDGRGPSIWDTFSHRPGATANGETGDVACDHYHRYRQDVALMNELGLDAYRFSIAWPRVQPDGSGAVNPAGLQFYDRLLDELCAYGIKPVATMYHWDLPQPLEDGGGWTVRDTAYRFADYAAVVQRALGDRVARWITLNEPFCSSMLGYGSGRHAPGRREGRSALAAAHHLLLGHGLALERLRSERPEGQYGVTLNLTPVRAAGPQDAAAARRANVLFNTLFTDPVLAGRYPAKARDVWPAYGEFSFIQPDDLSRISTPLDFLGVNYYFPTTVAESSYDVLDPAARTAFDIGIQQVVDPTAETTEMDWPVDPSGLGELLNWITQTYPGRVPAIEITENGRACADVVTDGHIDDPERIQYLADHLAVLADRVANGVPVRAYFCWSLLDNFEWAEGYAKRFGIVYTDYATQARIPKASAYWYRDLIQTHRDRRQDH
jgi:beta-glucosidase